MPKLKINMASSGIGSASHVTGELFKMMAGVDMVHVPYRANYLPDLLSGQMHVTFAPTPSVIGYIQQGQLRPLGVTSATRASAHFPAHPARLSTSSPRRSTPWSRNLSQRSGL